MDFHILMYNTFWKRDFLCDKNKRWNLLFLTEINLCDS